jgi:hypothetical protein
MDENEKDELVRRLRKSGVDFYNKNDYKNAIKEFDKAIKFAPGDAKAYRHRGMAYFYDKQYGMAIADFKKALELDPNNAMDHPNNVIKQRLCEALERQEAAPDPIINGSVPHPKERFGQLEESLKKALGENKGIRLRANVAGTRNKVNTYICFGTKRMDERFPRDPSKPGHWNNGEKYYYWFHLSNEKSNKMRGCFEFGPKDQDEKTKRIMEESRRRYHGIITSTNGLRIKFFDLNINLRRVFSDDEVRREVNKTIKEMLSWEDEYLQELKNI